MDPYPHIAAKYPGAADDIRAYLLSLAPDDLEGDLYRLVNDLHWLIGEVGRLREDKAHLLGVLEIVRGENERAREAALRPALARLVAVAGALSYHQAGVHGDELCSALAEARATLRGGDGR